MSAVAIDRSKYLPYLKERWIEPNAIQLAIFQNAPLLGLLEKEADEMGGRYMHVPLMRVGPVGRSASYTKARSNAIGSTMVGFDVTYVSNYQIVFFDGNAVDDAGGNDNAIADLVDNEMTAGMATLRKDMQQGVFGNVGGSRGRIGSIATGNAGANCRIVLLNITDSKFFEEGMLLAASANDGTATGHTLRGSGATIAVTAIDRIAGYLEFASDVTATISGLTANDYLFVDGDFKSKMTGLAGWFPVTAPTTGDNLFGIDRSINVNVLSGLRKDISGVAIEQGLVDAAADADLYDAHFDLYVINPVRWGKFANSLGADRANRLTDLVGSAGKATVSYRAIQVSTNFGDVPVVADGGCPLGDGYGLTKASLKIGHVGGDLVRIVEDDGLMLRRETTIGDGWALDIKGRSNLACKQPGQNMHLTF